MADKPNRANIKFKQQTEAVMKDKQLSTAIGLSDLLSIEIGCSESDLPLPKNSSQVSPLDASSQELFDVYIESLKLAIQKEREYETYEKQFENIVNCLVAADANYRLARQRLTKLAREAARTENDLSIFRKVQVAKREHDERLACLKSLNVELDALGSGETSAAECRKAEDESQAALLKFIETTASTKAPLEKKKLENMYRLRRAYDKGYLRKASEGATTEHSRTAIKEFEIKLTQLVKAEVAYDGASWALELTSFFLNLEETFAETLISFPDDTSKLDANLVSLLQEQGRELDRIENAYTSAQQALDQTTSDLAKAQKEYAEAFRNLVESTN